MPERQDFPDRENLIDVQCKSDDYFRYIFENAPVGIFQSTPEGRFISLNPTLARMFRYDSPEEMREAITNIATELFVHPEKRNDIVRAVYQSKEFLRFETDYRRRDGSVFFANLYLKAVRGQDGAVFLEGFVEDITDRKHAEKALIESEERLSDIINFLPDPTFAVDTKGRVILWNQAAEKLTGVAADEIIGKSNYEHGLVFYGKRRPMLLDSIQTASPEFIQLYLHFEREDDTLLAEWYSPTIGSGGSILWGKARSLRNHAGDIVGAIETVRDITERKQMEEKLIEEKRLSEAIINTFPGRFNMINSKGKVIWWNKSENDSFDYTSDEQGYRDAYAAVIEEDQPAAKQALNDIISNGHGTVELRLKRDNGNIRYYYFTGNRIDIRGEPFAVIAGIDVTEHKRAEDEKRAFYRETIRSVTQGKLELVPRRDTEKYLQSAAFEVGINTPQDTVYARQLIESYLASCGVNRDELMLYVTGVGEAMTNALKHASSGCVCAGADNVYVWVLISDSGPGIETLTLPSATLRTGYSTKVSMGMGYSIMLDVSDRVLLNTGHEGTTVILLKDKVKPATILSLEDLPDTWDRMPAI